LKQFWNSKGQLETHWDSKNEMAEYWEKRKHEFNAEGQKMIDVIVAVHRLEAATEALK
jgi:DNA polymerase III delta prime subunit